MLIDHCHGVAPEAVEDPGMDLAYAARAHYTKPDGHHDFAKKPMADTV